MNEMESRSTRPRWRRIIDFPLVALVIGTALILAAGAFNSWLIEIIPLRGTLLSTFIKSVLTTAIVVLIYKLVVTRLGERPRDDLRATDSAFRDALLGLAGGGLLFAAVVAVAAIVGVYRYAGPGDPVELLFAILIVGVVPAISEEILIRGVIFRFLEEFAGSWIALALTSLLFGLAHGANPNATLFSSLAIALEAGVLLGGAYLLTRNLWLAIGLHAGWNITQGGIFGLPVSGFATKGLLRGELGGDPLLSGGSFGLEASLIAVVLVTAAGAWLVMLAVCRGNMVGNWWQRRRLAAGDTPHPLPTA